MDLQVFRTGDAEYGRWIKALICGDPGAGKTLISSTFPNPFYASAEGGLMSVADRGVPATKVTSSDQLVTIRMLMDQPPDVRAKLVGQALGVDHPIPVDTLIIDTIDEVARIMARERMEQQKHESMQLQDYGWLGDQLRSLIRGLRNLDLNVVFTCHLKETQDNESGRVYFKPSIIGAVSDEISGYVDLAVLLTARPVIKVEDNESKRVIVRTLQTFPDANHPWIKDRSGKLPMEVNINFENDYSRLNAYIFGNLDSSAEKDVPVLSQPELEVDRKEAAAVAMVMEAFPGSEVISAEEAAEDIHIRVLDAMDGSADVPVPLTRDEKRLLREQKKAEAEGAPAEAPLAFDLDPEIELPTLNEAKQLANEDKSNVNTTTGEVHSYTCTACSAEFADENVRDLTMMKFKKVLCMDCMRAEGKKGK